MILCLVIYFALLLGIGRLTSRRHALGDFFHGGHSSPWPVVAFGMIGASISGVSFVSVPGMVLTGGMTYLQLCLGFIAGYFIVAFVLLPVYYRHGLTTIYGYLGRRLGTVSYRTSATFFILSKLAATVVKFYLACHILQTYALDAYGVPPALTIVVLTLLIWAYTRRGGIRTLVWTDTFNTLCLFGAIILIILYVASAMGMGPAEAVMSVVRDSRSHIFEWHDIFAREYFWKQFISGAFIVVVMTGLDQDMMQKNLTCRTLRAAQKDMCCYGFVFVPANLLLLSLGILLAQYAGSRGVALPAAGDTLLPMFAATGELGQGVLVLFSIGLLASSISTADSALTAVSTSLNVDILGRSTPARWLHPAVCALFAAATIAFRHIGTASAIDTIYTLVSYAYSPLLGIFAFALFTRRRVLDRLTPYFAIATPVLSFAVSEATLRLFGYHFGYELLVLGGALMMTMMLAASERQPHANNAKK